MPCSPMASVSDRPPAPGHRGSDLLHRTLHQLRGHGGPQPNTIATKHSKYGQMAFCNFGDLNFLESSTL